MKNVFFYGFVLLCIFSMEISALPSLPTIPKDHILKVSFTQRRYLTDIPKPIVSRGNLLLWPGKGLIWRINEPFSQTILITKKGLCHVEEGQKKSMRRVGHEGVILEMMSKLLEGSFAELKEFTMDSMPSLHKKWKVRLTPAHKNLQDFLSAIEVEGDKHISRLALYRPNGDRDEIVFDNLHIYRDQDRDKAMSLEEKTWFDD